VAIPIGTLAGAPRRVPGWHAQGARAAPRTQSVRREIPPTTPTTPRSTDALWTDHAWGPVEVLDLTPPYMIELLRRATAARCSPGARLIIRFGALPSAPRGDPGKLLLASLRLAGGWEALSVSDAGIPPAIGARQASQLRDAGEHVPEIDVLAIRSG